MQEKLYVIMMGLVLATSAYADSVIIEDQTIIRSELDQGDSKLLYKALKNVPNIRYVSEDGIVEISCKEEIPSFSLATPSCFVQIFLDPQASDQTRVDHSGQFVTATVPHKEDSMFFDSLDLKFEILGWSRYRKTFQTSEKQPLVSVHWKQMCSIRTGKCDLGCEISIKRW